jgi:hypothetical protein
MFKFSAPPIFCVRTVKGRKLAARGLTYRWNVTEFFVFKIIHHAGLFSELNFVSIARITEKEQRLTLCSENGTGLFITGR